MNTSQMLYLLRKLTGAGGVRINAELANADYNQASGVHSLLHTEWYFDTLAPDAIRSLPDLQTNASSLLSFYGTLDVDSAAVRNHSRLLTSHYVLTPALGLYSFHDFATFADFAAYYDAHNVCGITMTRVNETVFDTYAKT